MNDLSNKEDVKVLVDSFYQNVRMDNLLGPIFANKIPADHWPAHLEKMYSFWNTILFSVQDYSGAPFPPHQKLPVGKPHFDRWVALFTATLQEHFEGPVADNAKARAELMAVLFMSKIERYQA